MNFYLKYSNFFIDEELSVFNIIKSLPNVGVTTTIKLCKRLNVENNVKFKELPLHSYKILKFWLRKNAKKIKNVKLIQKKYIKNLIKINCYKGFRHINGLPVRGQRTHSNSKTKKRLRLLRDFGIGIKVNWKEKMSRVKQNLYDKKNPGAKDKKRLKKKKKGGNMKVVRKRKVSV
jgi:small subunit ribosomal protein S13